MIFVTVGTQLPFDRLTQAVDRWSLGQRGREVLAQVARNGQRLVHSSCVESLSAENYEQAFDSASLVVSHAGIGVVLSAIDRGRPLIVMPRRPELNEHRTEHQIGVCRYKLPQLGVYVAWTESQLVALLDEHERCPLVPPMVPGRSGLVAHLREFVMDRSMVGGA